MMVETVIPNLGRTCTCLGTNRQLCMLHLARASLCVCCSVLPALQDVLSEADSTILSLGGCAELVGPEDFVTFR